MFLEIDLENLDSVSMVAARNINNPTSSLARPLGDPTCAGDSGRGESPESCSSSTSSGRGVVIRGGQGQAGNKAPRPISAVPSEYSDISTSSCRSNLSEGDDESLNSSQNEQQKSSLVSNHGRVGVAPSATSSLARPLGDPTCAGDSGRGESPESCSSSTSSGRGVVIRGGQGQAGNKAPRPISAVPSEYSDISTSSCRSNLSEGDDESLNSSQNAAN